MLKRNHIIHIHIASPSSGLFSCLSCWANQAFKENKCRQMQGIRRLAFCAESEQTRGKVTLHCVYRVSKLTYILLIFPSIVSTLLELTINFSTADDFSPRCEMAKYFKNETYFTGETRTKPLLVTSPAPCLERAAAAPWGRAVRRWACFTTCALT